MGWENRPTWEGEGWGEGKHEWEYMGSGYFMGRWVADLSGEGRGEYKG